MYYFNPHLAWGEEHEETMRVAVLSTLVCLLMIWVHPRPLYLIRVERYPTFRCQLGPLENPMRRISGTERNAGRRACEFYPLLMFSAGLSFGLWSAWLAQINHALGVIPAFMLCFFCGMFSRFDRYQLQRLCRICAGQYLYETVEQVASAFDTTIPETDSDSDIEGGLEGQSRAVSEEERWQGADTDYGSSDDDHEFDDEFDISHSE